MVQERRKADVAIPQSRAVVKWPVPGKMPVPIKGVEMECDLLMRITLLSL